MAQKAATELALEEIRAQIRAMQERIKDGEDKRDRLAEQQGLMANEQMKLMSKMSDKIESFENKFNLLMKGNKKVDQGMDEPTSSVKGYGVFNTPTGFNFLGYHNTKKSGEEASGVGGNFDIGSTDDKEGSRGSLKAPRQSNRYDGFNPIIPKMDFSKFDGTDPDGWCMKCRCYFDLYPVRDEYKVHMAYINFTDKASDWFRGYCLNRNQLSFEELSGAVRARFGYSNGISAIEEFNRVQQEGKVLEYMKAFEKAKTRLVLCNPFYNDQHFLRTFISGLKEEIKYL